MHIDTIEISMPARTTQNHLQALSDDQCDGLIIDRIIIHGKPDDSSKARWMETDSMGVMVNSEGVVIRHLYAEMVHIPLKLMGKHSVCEYLQTRYTSGDGFQLCGDFVRLDKADIHGLLDVYPYEVDHSDGGMMFAVRGAKVITGAQASYITLHKSAHKWDHPNPQGILVAPDGKADDCHVSHCELYGVHQEHGVRFGFATNCTANNVKTDGAIGFGDRKKGQKGYGNNAIDCEAPVIRFEDESQIIAEPVGQIPKEEQIEMNRKRFFDEIRTRLFDGELSQQQVSGIEAILDAWDKQPSRPDTYVAYSLATVFHEVDGTMQPIKEYGGQSYYHRMYDIDGDRPDKAIRLGNCNPGDGAKYCGHGFVQLTGRANYEKQGKKHGVDLVGKPELMMKDEISAKVLVGGMLAGDFTGRSLSYYDKNGRFDAFNARRIINAMVEEDAARITGYYEDFLSAIQFSNETPLEPEPTPKPPTPRHHINPDAFQTANVKVRQPEEMPNYYDEERDGPITPEPIYTPEPVVADDRQTDQPVKASKIANFLSGKKTHLGMFVSGGIGLAAMFGFIPGITAEAGANMLQSAFAISGTRSAIPKLMIMGIKAYARQRAK